MGSLGGPVQCLVVFISALPSPPLPWPQGLHSLDLQKVGPQRWGSYLTRMGDLCHLPKASYAPEVMVGLHIAATTLREELSPEGDVGLEKNWSGSQR